MAGNVKQDLKAHLRVRFFFVRFFLPRPRTMPGSADENRAREVAASPFRVVNAQHLGASAQQNATLFGAFG